MRSRRKTIEFKGVINSDSKRLNLHADIISFLSSVEMQYRYKEENALYSCLLTQAVGYA